MRIILLSSNDNVKSLYELLLLKNNEIFLIHGPLTLGLIDEINPDMVISYNYKYIVSEEVIDKMGNNIINLHTSYLPWNKGASPNIWSFIDDTPKGVTIHRLEKGLDTGKIIVQKRLAFDEEKETLFSTYSRLNEEIVNLFIDNWEKIASGKYILKNQDGKGSYHRVSDLKTLLDGRSIDYSMTIKEFKDFITSCKED